MALLRKLGADIAEILAGDHESTIEGEEFTEQARGAEECDESQTAERNIREDLVGSKHDAEGLEEDEPPGPFEANAEWGSEGADVNGGARRLAAGDAKNNETFGPPDTDNGDGCLEESVGALRRSGTQVQSNVWFRMRVLSLTTCTAVMKRTVRPENG